MKIKVIKTAKIIFGLAIILIIADLLLTIYRVKTLETMIAKENELCATQGGLWEPKTSCAQIIQRRRLTFWLSLYKDLDSKQGYECVHYYIDAGKKCTSSDQCDGYCRVKNVVDKDIVGECESDNRRDCCKNIVENQNSVDFGRCLY